MLYNDMYEMNCGKWLIVALLSKYRQPQEHARSEYEPPQLKALN